MSDEKKKNKAKKINFLNKQEAEQLLVELKKNKQDTSIHYNNVKKYLEGLQ